eukprot:CAMPEP_0113712894 /NCGR_PEP_ID=MMETSP0038_2-20120614/31659_1 /TAXON_ID=2898 /ORGANISM="Cryptomonas paramecium" /LENGTH=395 /DNA_ID=CAMNT_0000639499 /DNA_START=425 /DNA_END=1609 /DNA_ORIENTATION=+ /assembly_acc=CAM_ASM_000170
MALITFVTVMLAAPSGVGGGGILVPMYLVFGHFTPHFGIPLSKATIFGGAVANNFLNVQRRHPKANRPLIDYKTVMLMEPVLLLGSILGVFFNYISPSWLITILIVVTLMYTGYTTTRKAIETYQKETKQAETAAEKDALIKEKLDPNALDQIADPELREIVEAESKTDARALQVIFFAWLVVFVCSVLKGGEGVYNLVECGSPIYWFLVLLPVPITVAIVYFMGNVVRDEHAVKAEKGYVFADGDLMWTEDNVRVYPLYSIIAGFCAGALGIAGGTILGPVLLQLGMLPLAATATSGFTVLFTASSTTLQFLIMGQLQADYAIVFCLVGLTGGGVGSSVVGWLVQKYHKTWFIVAVLAAVLFLSAALMGYSGYLNHLQQVAHGLPLGMRPVCHA